MSKKGLDKIRLEANANKDERIIFQSMLFQKYSDRISHFDLLREKYLNFSIIIFAGLFAFGMHLQKFIHQICVSVVIILLMALFCMLDRRLHKISHLYQSLRDMHYSNICFLINNPGKVLEYEAWDSGWRKRAEWFSLQPRIFYALIFGGALTALIFKFVEPFKLN